MSAERLEWMNEMKQGFWFYIPLINHNYPRWIEVLNIINIVWLTLGWGEVILNAKSLQFWNVLPSCKKKVIMAAMAMADIHQTLARKL